MGRCLNILDTVMCHINFCSPHHNSRSTQHAAGSVARVVGDVMGLATSIMTGILTGRGQIIVTITLLVVGFGYLGIAVLALLAYQTAICCLAATSAATHGIKAGLMLAGAHDARIAIASIPSCVISIVVAIIFTRSGDTGGNTIYIILRPSLVVFVWVVAMIWVMAVYVAIGYFALGTYMTGRLRKLVPLPDMENQSEDYDEL